MAPELESIATIDARRAAQLLGISKNRLYIWTREGKIPCVRLGRSVRYRVATLRAWLEAQETANQGRA